MTGHEQTASSPTLTIAELEFTLQQFGCPLDEWGGNGSKDIAQLHAEITSGEAVLEVLPSGELARRTAVSWLDVYYLLPNGEALKLVEDRQEITGSEGEVIVKRRELPSSIGEKLKAGETPAQGAQRGLEEELGITTAYQVIGGDSDYREDDSSVYPGLKTHSQSFYFGVRIGDEDFRPEGYVEKQSEKTSFFIWVPYTDR